MVIVLNLWLHLIHLEFSVKLSVLLWILMIHALIWIHIYEYIVMSYIYDYYNIVMGIKNSLNY